MAVPIAGNVDNTTLASATLANNSKLIVDNAFTKLPLLYWLRKIKNKRTVDGGEPIHVNLEYADNDTIKSINKRSKLDTNEQDIITQASYYWGLVGGTVSINKFDIEVINRGSGKLFDMLNAIQKNATKTLAKVVSDMLWDDTRASNEAIWAIGDMVNSANPTVAEYGGLSRTTYTWWASTKTDMTATPDITVYAIDHLYNTLSDGPDHPDLCIMGQTQYEQFESLLLQSKIYEDDRLADSGFVNLKHKGMTIMLDKGAATNYNGSVLMFNSEYIDFIEAEGWNPQVTPFRDVVDQPAKVAQILWAGQLTCSNCSKQGQLYNLTTSY